MQITTVRPHLCGSRNKIENDKRIIRYMIALYCRHKLGARDVPDEYRLLAEYACTRLEHCRFGAGKPACKNCPTHCYKPEMREKIRTVMRWAGPRMILYAPMAAIHHLLNHWRNVCVRIVMLKMFHLPDEHFPIIFHHLVFLIIPKCWIRLSCMIASVIFLISFRFTADKR